MARVRPVEALSGEGQPGINPGETAFKAMSLDRKTRHAQTEAVYPTFGSQLNGGFLSHVAGKLFLRTGIDGLEPKIHNAFVGEQENPGQQELPGTELLHLHAASFAEWSAHFRYRHQQGAYRPALAPARPRDRGGMTMHELFAFLLEEQGEPGLRRFYEEVCTATPELRARLAQHGLLRTYRLDLDAKRAKHFPDLA